MPKFIFTNITGTYVFSENHKMVDGLAFKNVEQFENKQEYEEKLSKKHGDLEQPREKDLQKILQFFKDKKFYNEFSKKNEEITKLSIKDSVSHDILLIQTIDAIEEIDRVLNLLTKRLREWYALYNPEAEDRFNDHEEFVSIISKKNKAQLLKELKVTENESMGHDFSKDDLDAINLLIAQINNFYKIKQNYDVYLEKLEKKLCPNMSVIAGTSIAAKLIAHAGSLKRLAEMPASTLQVLGAEKALFRHMRNKKRNLPPKYGLLHEHPLIQRANHKEHGKVARALADKLSIAARVDFYKGKPVGEEYKKELMKKFNIKF